MTPINGTWEPPSRKRCDRKVGYRSLVGATVMAKEATKRAGHLILAYECPDCGRFHIGRSDKAGQIIFERESKKYLDSGGKF